MLSRSVTFICDIYHFYRTFVYCLYNFSPESIFPLSDAKSIFFCTASLMSRLNENLKKSEFKSHSDNHDLLSYLFLFCFLGSKTLTVLLVSSVVRFKLM